MDAQQIRAAARATVAAAAAAGTLPPIPVSAYGAISLMRVQPETTQQPKRRAKAA